MFQGQLLAISTAAQRKVPMQAVDEIEVVAGQGLAGDRYAAKRSSQEVSLIESEAIEAVARDYRLPLTHTDTRRNLLTRGTPLNHLVGRQFAVGDVTLEGIELCEPCGYLESLTSPGIEAALKHRGGLRARVVQGGVLRVGDEIRPLP